MKSIRAFILFFVVLTGAWAVMPAKWTPQFDFWPFQGEYVDLELFCGVNAFETSNHAYNLATGNNIISIPENISKPTLTPTSIDSMVRKRTGSIFFIISMDSDHNFYPHRCSERCTQSDFFDAFSICKNKRSCGVVGVVSNDTFFPIYLNDEVGGHICNGRWSDNE